MSSLRTIRATGQPRVIASGDHVARGRLDVAFKGDRRDQRRAEPKIAHDICGHARPTRDGPEVVDSQREAWGDVHPCGQRPQQGIWSVCWKKKARPRIMSAFSLLFGLPFDKVGKPTERNHVQRPRGQAATARQNPNDMVSGMRRKPAPTSDLNVLNLYLNCYQTEGYSTSGTDVLKRQNKGKNKEKVK